MNCILVPSIGFDKTHKRNYCILFVVALSINISSLNAQMWNIIDNSNMHKKFQ